MPSNNNNKPTKSPSRQTAEAVVEAFNRMDISTIVSYRSDDCQRHILPSTLGHSATDNHGYRKQLESLKPVFRNFSLQINDMVEDREANRICMYLRARADTDAGEYVNEYVWFLDFDESGTRITNVKEFVDTVMNRDFWPKLAMAMKDYQATQSGGAQSTSSS